MRIGLNLLFLLPGIVGGTESYATALIEELALLDSVNEYLLFLNAESASLPLVLGRNARRVACPVHATRRGARYAWEQLALPSLLRRESVDLVHSLGYVGPLAAPCPQVVTIHDLNYRDPAVSMAWHKRRILGGFVETVAVRAAHILTMSEFSKRQIVEQLGIPAEKVTTSHLGPRRQVRPPDEGTLAWNGVTDDPYVVVFSGSAIHKNIPRLIAAFGQIAQRAPHRLVVIGHLPSDGCVQHAIAVNQLSERVTLTGYLPESEVARALAGADALVFPSLYEGFGLPILDAQAARVPVACSSAGSLPEVAGEGAVVFDPLTVDSIAETVLSILTDRALHDKLVCLGQKNVTRFSWRTTAQTTLGIYERYGGLRAGTFPR
jgi:glycosyltransferase involved in cell wall biosynthesis